MDRLIWCRPPDRDESAGFETSRGCRADMMCGRYGMWVVSGFDL